MPPSHCPAGHEYIESNTLVRTKTHARTGKPYLSRECRRCRAVYAMEVGGRGGRLSVEIVDDVVMCRHCGVAQATAEFNRDRRYRSGLQPWCRACYQEYRESRRERTRLLERRSRYGVSTIDQVERWTSQGGACASCGEAILAEEAQLDHDHTTGVMRGFLCPSCNRTIGQARDDIERLRACADYLEQRACVRTL